MNLNNNTQKKGPAQDDLHNSVAELRDMLQSALESLAKLATRFEEINSSNQKHLERFTTLIKDDESGKRQKALDAFRIVANEQIKMLQQFYSILEPMPQDLKQMKLVVELLSETLAKKESVSKVRGE